ncbi:9243_t:CDS:2, partial [Dentiscutata erythropus]
MILCFYIVFFYYRHFTRINPLPGPIPIPIIGIFMVNNDLIDQINKLSKIYGHNGIFEFYLAGYRQIVITKAEYAKKFLAPSTKECKIYWKRFPLKLEVFEDHGINQLGLAFNENFNYWKFYRQIYMQAIGKLSNSNRTTKLLNELFEELSNYWLDLTGNNYNSGVIDLTAWTKRFLTDLMFLLSTGKRSFAIKYCYLKLKNEKVTKEIMDSEHYIESLTYFLVNIRMAFVPKFLRRLPLIRNHVDKFMDVRNFLFERILENVREKRKEIEEIGSNDNFDTKQLEDDSLTSFIIVNTPYESHPQKRPMNDIEISSILFDALTGSTDSVCIMKYREGDKVASAFSFVLYDIAHNPAAKIKLLDEINSVIGDDLTRQITLDDLEKLKYCEATVLESLRMRSPTAMLSRYNTEPDEVAGYKWPPNTSFLMN